MNVPESILFVCTANSARSILAEAITNQQFGERLQAVSAGSQPAAEVHPQTFEILKRNKMSTEGLHSKSWNEFGDRGFDLVVTLCEGARDDACPKFPGDPPQAHWTLPDPPSAEHTASTFEAVYDALLEAIGLLAHGPNPSLEGRAAEATRVLNRRFAPRRI